MECTEAKELMLDLIDEALESEKRDGVLEHMKKCPGCREEYDSLQRMSSVLKKGFALEKEGIAAPSGLKNALRVSLEGEKKAGTGYKRVLKRACIAAALILTTFIAAINTSPALANYLNGIPVVQELVKLGLVDKGLISAVEGEMGQAVGKSCTKNGITITVHEVVATDNRTEVFFSIDWPEYVDKMPPNPPLIDSSNVMWGGSASHYDEKNRRTTGVWDFEALRGSYPRMWLSINQIRLDDKTIIRGPWKIDFRVDKSKAKGKQMKFTVNRKAAAGGGSITIKDVVTTPGETVVSFENDGSVLGPGTLVLVDQEGNEYQSQGGSMSNKGGKIMYSLVYPAMPAKVIVRDVREAVDLNESIALKAGDKYPMDASLHGSHWSIISMERQGSRLIVRVPVMEAPAERIIKASLRDKSGRIWLYEDSNGMANVEKVPKDNKAVFYQLLTFDGVDADDSDFVLTIDRAEVYTPANAEIKIDR